jgi:tRNA threonylcarbamoyladenosine biosynthesis protein TsaE
MIMSYIQKLVVSRSAEETRRLGEIVGRLLPGNAVVTLAGDLGAGKTTFVQGLGVGLGVKGPITSPTFVLINRYRCGDGRHLQHADCYRLANAPLEMWDVGLADLFADDDIVVVEWADRIPQLLPPEYLEVAIDHDDGDVRRLAITAHGERYLTLLRELSGLVQEQV